MNGTIIEKIGETVTGFFHRKRAVPAISPRFISWQRRPYGPFLFNLQSTAGVSCEILASTNLVNWAAIGSLNPDSGYFDYVDSEASKFSYRFYRAVAAGLASENVIGYVSISTPPGFTLIANPLKAEDDRLSALLPKLPNGSALSKFDVMQSKLCENTYNDGCWSNPNDVLALGEGASFFNPTSEYRAIIFTGIIIAGQGMTPLPAGFSLRSSRLPKAGDLDTDLEFPISNGDVIYAFDRDRQKLNVHSYENNKWKPAAPIIGVGESFWAGKAVASNWIQKLPMQ